MIEWAETNYPEMFITLSDELAEIRSKLSKDVYKEGTDKYRGDDEHRISQLGIISELIARHMLIKAGCDIKKLAPMLDLSPVVECDIVMSVYSDIYKIDVKGIKSKGKTLRINYDSHNNNQKEVSHYLFIQPLTTTTARYCWFSHKDIDKWETIDSTYSKCYTNPIER